MKAIILVGGYGTRLRPLTCQRPKQLLPIANFTLIEYILTQLKLEGIKEIILAGGYGIERLQEALGDGDTMGVQLKYSCEEKPLGTAGPIKQAEPYLKGSGTFFALNGDIVARMDYRQLLNHHKNYQATATIALHRVDDPSRYGVVDLKPDGQIRAFIEKPAPGIVSSNLINAGCYVLDESVLDIIPSNKTTSIERETFPMLCAKGGLYGWEHKGLWIDTGTPASYLEANHAILSTIKGEREKINLTNLLKKGVKITHPVHVGENTIIGKSCSIGPNATIGQNVTIGANVRIHNAIIFDNVIIEDDVVIDSSVIGESAIIGKGIHLRELALIGDAASISEGAVIPPGSRICPNRRVKKGATPYTVFC